MIEPPTRARIVYAFLVAPVGGFIISGAIAFVPAVLATRDAKLTAAALVLEVGMASMFGTPVAWVVQLVLVAICGAVPPAGRRGMLRTIAIGAVAGAVVALGLIFFAGYDKFPLVLWLMGAVLGASSAFTYCTILHPKSAQLELP